MENKTLVVNFLAGPGAGKSTFAGSVFSELKWKGVNCELVTEYAKDKVWEESMLTLKNQLYVLGKQSHRVFRLEGKVDCIVTDSSVLMSMLYSTKNRHKTDEFRQVVVDDFNSYWNINFFVNRNDHYVDVGRYHSQEEALKIDSTIRDILNSYDINYIDVDFKRESVDFIVGKIIKELNENK